MRLPGLCPLKSNSGYLYFEFNKKPCRISTNKTKQNKKHNKTNQKTLKQKTKLKNPKQTTKKTPHLYTSEAPQTKRELTEGTQPLWADLFSLTR